MKTKFSITKFPDDKENLGKVRENTERMRGHFLVVTRIEPFEFEYIGDPINLENFLIECGCEVEVETMEE